MGALSSLAKQQTRGKITSILTVAILTSTLLFIFLALMQTPFVQAGGGIDCNDSSWPVSNESDLNAAIICFNNKTISGEYTISLSQNISMTTNTDFIYNQNNAGVTLLLEGNRFILDGQWLPGIRPFTIGPTETVTMQNITIIRGNVDVPGDDGGNGGAIANLGTLTIANSTIANNKAYDGGAIYNLNGNITIINSTLAGNSGGNGGAIYNSGAVTITNGTISDNYASSNNGGSFYNESGTITVNNSILASDQSNNCAGTITSGGYNLVNDNSCNFAETGDINNTDPMNIPFIDSNNNWVYALLPGSPAIDAGNTTLAADQIGNARPHGAADDIGALESQGFSLTATASKTNNFHTSNLQIFPSSITDGASQTTLINTPFADPLALSVSSANNYPLTGGSVTFSAPASGAGVTFTETAVTIDDNGVASLAVTANDTEGSYIVTADTIGNNGSALAYNLTNISYDCSLQPWLVADEEDFNDAISCYNDVTIANTYTISITQNISLTSSSTTISNTVESVSLLLDGNDYTVDGQNIIDIRPFTINSNTNVTINNIKITGGNIIGRGGGIENLGELTINNSTLSDNTATVGGGGIFNNGTLTVSNSTLANNTANLGGGIYNSGTLIASNSTLSSNSASDSGGGIFTIGIATINNNTLWGNSAINGGGIFNSNTVTFSNSIIANSSGGDCFGTINNGGHNLIEDTSCGFSGGDDPLLEPLANNGGDTWTHALLPESPAIDAGDTTLTTDQRGIARPQGDADDIGAFEAPPSSPEFTIFLPAILNQP